jgi:hypothetical protein
MSDAGRFKALFSGFSKAHGQYTIKKTDEGGKKTGQAITRLEPASLDHYHNHLKGDYGLGIIPLTDDDGCYFSAIDIDTKDEQGAPRKVDPVGLAKQLEVMKSPLLVCQSKSGGAHVYAFFKTEEPADDVRDYMEGVAAKLGYGGAEIFPKQSTRGGPDDVGNWINLPYFGGQRACFLPEGGQLSLGEFLNTAEGHQFSLLGLEQPAGGTSGGSEADDGSIFADGPPCLRHLEYNGGFPSGTRNEGLFNVAVYLKKRYGDEWKSHLSLYNAQMCDPPLGAKELAVIEKSADRKDYQYRCKQAPIAAHCQRRTCLKRRFGVGRTDGGKDISSLTFYRTNGSEDAVYVGCEIGGKRILVQADDFFQVGKLNRIVWARCGFMASSLNQGRWQEFITRLGQEADVQDIPSEFGEAGYLWVHIEDFLSQKAQAKTVDEILLGKPFLEDSRVWFRQADLADWLGSRRVQYGTHQRLTHLLRDKGGEDKVRKVGKKATRLWSLPAPELPESDAPPTQQEQSEVF